MEKRSPKRMRKIKSLVFLMLLTLILAITATYAWFSTQRDIEVSGMRLNVEVAESLQISLDGEIWTQSIQIANMRQFYGTYTGTGDGFAIYQAKKPDNGGNTNYVPTELLPVSSAGEVANGKLQFVQGTIESNADGTTKLTGITACSENDLTATETVANRQNGNASHPYLVFDMYLRNISAKTTGLDELLLGEGSAVWINNATTDDEEQEGAGVAGTGLEYSARVGMVVYGNTISTTATDSGTQTIGQQIRELEADGNEVAAIWEPNHKEHTAYVVANNGRGITSTSQEVDTYGVKVAVASAETKEIANINSTTDTNLVAVNTFTPNYTTAEDGVDETTIITDTAGNNLGIAPNQISKVRIYVWLEGQDPDCIDLASTGDKLNVTLKLTKDKTTTTDKNTYIGQGKLTGEVTAPTVKNSLIYSGEEQVLVEPASTPYGEVYYKLESGEWSTTVPTATDAGIYKVYYYSTGDETHDSTSQSQYVTVVIAKKEPEVTAPTANVLTYNESAQELIQAGESTSGIMQYKLSDSEVWNYTIPIATNAGTYTVEYRSPETANYLPTTPESINVTIAKAIPNVTPPTAQTLTYMGNAQTLISEGSTLAGSLVYKVGSGSYSTNLPTATDAGTYTISYYSPETENYIATEEASINVTIQRASTASVSAITRLVYSGTEQTGVTGSGINWDDSSGNISATNAGTYTAYATPDSNHSWEDGSYEQKAIEWSIDKADPVITHPRTNSWTYNGSSLKLIQPGSSSAGQLMYKLDTAMSYSTQVPHAVNARSAINPYVISYYSPETQNYKASEVYTVSAFIYALARATASASDKTYTGEVQMGVTGQYVTWSGQTTGTTVGTYTAYARPNRNYAWIDNGGTEQRMFTWKITQ